MGPGHVLTVSATYLMAALLGGLKAGFLNDLVTPLTHQIDAQRAVSGCRRRAVDAVAGEQYGGRAIARLLLYMQL